MYKSKGIDIIIRNIWYRIILYNIIIVYFKGIFWVFWGILFGCLRVNGYTILKWDYIVRFFQHIPSPIDLLVRLHSTIKIVKAIIL